MGKQPIFDWNEGSGICTCIIYLNDFLQGYGIAQCHAQDFDVKSKRTGEQIAELRAQINLLQNYKNRELRPGLKALLHLKGTMIKSAHYNPDSYESKRLNIEIKNFKKDIEDIEEAIQGAKEQLYKYINLKEEMYQRIRRGDRDGYKEEDTETLLKDISVYERVIKNDSTT